VPLKDQPTSAENCDAAKPAPPKSVHAQEERRAGRAECAAGLDGISQSARLRRLEGNIAPAEEGNRPGPLAETWPLDPAWSSIGSERTEAFCVFGLPRPPYTGAAPEDVAGIMQINVIIPAGVISNAVPLSVQIGSVDAERGDNRCPVRRCLLARR
jgi:hypothetical protein